jgi:hypothetical protein
LQFVCMLSQISALVPGAPLRCSAIAELIAALPKARIVQL